jgi:hypothetical protein
MGNLLDGRSSKENEAQFIVAGIKSEIDVFSSVHDAQARCT